MEGGPKKIHGLFLSHKIWKKLKKKTKKMNFFSRGNFSENSLQLNLRNTDFGENLFVRVFYDGVLKQIMKNFFHKIWEAYKQLFISLVQPNGEKIGGRRENPMLCSPSAMFCSPSTMLCSPSTMLCIPYAMLRSPYGQNQPAPVQKCFNWWK